MFWSEIGTAGSYQIWALPDKLDKSSLEKFL